MEGWTNELKAVLAITHAVADQQQIINLTYQHSFQVTRWNWGSSKDPKLSIVRLSILKSHVLIALGVSAICSASICTLVMQFNWVSWKLSQVAQNFRRQQLANKSPLDSISSLITSPKFLTSLFVCCWIANTTSRLYWSSRHCIKFQSDDYSSQWSILRAVPSFHVVIFVPSRFHYNILSAISPLSETVIIGEEERLICAW